MILKIRKYGDKVLRNKSTAVEKIDDDENGLLYADGAGSCGTDHW
mgnify:CR=1 FL=1